MRNLEGYINEANSLKSFIKKEMIYLKTGERLGTFHNPKIRIKDAETQLKKVEAHISKQTSLNLKN
jgi:hypothetical protein